MIEGFKMVFNWMFITYFSFIVGILVFLVITVIVTIGGAFDLKFLFQSLKEEVLDEADDGRVRDV